MAIFWDSLNWQPACEWHHTRVKQKLEALFDQGLIDASSLWLNSEKAKQISRTRGGI
jgi:5-methylcytosine-specific restriction protein A